MSFRDQLEARIRGVNSRLCVGLDPRQDRIEGSVEDFLRRVIDEAAPYAAAFKPNSAYFEVLGWEGFRTLERLRGWIPREIPMILDGKRSDIGETQRYYAKSAFEVIGADAVTLNPYLGADTLEPFLAWEGKGIYLLGVTSNEGSRDVQLQRVDDRFVFELVQAMARTSREAGLVAGLTQADPAVWERIADVPLLVPGLGAQGGDLAVLAGSGRQAPVVVNVSRGVLYGEDGSTIRQRAERFAKQIQAAWPA